MTATATEALQRAIDSLGAVCVRLGIEETIIGGDGKGPNVTRVIQPALYAMSWGKRWYVTDPEGVELTKMLGAGAMIANTPTVMPAWWSPEQRFAYRYKVVDATGSEMEGYEDKRWPEAFDFGMERITADLETGAEIAA